MDYIYSISLFLLLLLLIAIDYICRLRKERRELRNYYDVLLTNILKGKHREKGLSNEKIIGTPGGGREYDLTDFPKSKEEVEEIAEKSISENNPFSDKIKCLTKHYFTKLPLFSHLITPLMLKRVKDLPIYENKEELQKALEEIKNVFGDDFEIIQNTTLMNLMCFFDELRKFHKMYGLSPEEYYEDNINMLIKWSGSSDEN